MESAPAATNGHPALLCKSLVIGYDWPLCRVPDLTLTPGRAHKIVAANGMGKSTLLRTLLGLHPPMAGEFWLDHDTTDPSRSICYLPPTNPLPQHASVAETWALFAHLEQISGDAVARAADSLGLSAVGDQPTAALSSGQARRLALVRILASHARVLVLDEPFAGIDSHYAGIVAAQLQALSVKRLVLYVAHDHSIGDSQVLRLVPYQHYSRDTRSGAEYD